MTDQDTVSRTLEHARGLLSYLIEHRQECEPSGPGATQLRNMLGLVTNMRTRVEESADDVTNVIKRLRDFSNTIERLKVPETPARETFAVRSELVESFRLAAEQLDRRSLVR